MIRNPNDIPGWFLQIEADAIVHAALHVSGKTGRLIEIGTWCGRSAAFISDALPGWKIHTIDPYPDHVVAIWGRNLQAHPRDIAKDNFAQRTNIKAHHEDSIVAASEWPQMFDIDILFLDGEHLESRVEQELKAWLPFMKHNAIILLHDAVGKPDFSSAIQRAANSALIGWTRVPAFEAGSLWAFKRV